MDCPFAGVHVVEVFKKKKKKKVHSPAFVVFQFIFCSMLFQLMMEVSDDTSPLFFFQFVCARFRKATSSLARRLHFSWSFQAPYNASVPIKRLVKKSFQKKRLHSLAFVVFLFLFLFLFCQYYLIKKQTNKQTNKQSILVP